MRVGIGYDSHRFAAGRRLVLGGVEVAHEAGLEGHSDADVVTHAVIDALLGAAGLGDLGTHFPPGEERWRDADSIDLLRTVLGMLAGPVTNVDVTVICERPRLDPHREQMQSNLAAVLGAPVTVKATSNEGMGWVGRGEGIAAIAVALLGLSRVESGLMDLGHLASPRRLAQRVRLGPLGPLSDVPFNVRTLAGAGVIRPVRPDKLVRVAHELVRWGASPAAGVAGGAITDPQRPIVIDEAGSLTYAQMHRRSNALAGALAERGVGPGDGVAIMCRNHRGFVESTLAVSKLGAGGLYMNTAFSGPQLVGVVERERPAALIYDEEFSDLLAEAGEGLLRLVAWSDGDSSEDPTLDQLIAAGDDADLAPPEESSRFVILTSGTTGSPKGAQRAQPETLGPLAAMFSRIPMHAGERTMIAAPMFHSWGLAHFMLGLSLGSTYVLERRFDPERTLRAVQERGATALIVVPVMMQRILQLPEEVLDRHPLASLRVTAASGSALPGPLAIEWMDRFGDNLYNLYGSTEVAWATIATPEDLRAAPGTAGRPPRGTAVKIVDPQGSELPAGETGRVFVGNEMAFEGYTGGGGKEVVEGLLSSGDVGHFDRDGRLFIDGRDDEMIVSGGENVFPREVEDLLAAHAAIAEVAVIGVADEEFGQRLKAFVVLREPGGLGEDEVREHVKRNLARYKVPRDVAFLDSLPRNATGKVLKRELA